MACSAWRSGRPPDIIIYREDVMALKKLQNYVNGEWLIPRVRASKR
jgi:hypothetical protein